MRVRVAKSIRMMAPVNYCYGLMLYFQGRWDEAEMQLQRTLEINPDFLGGAGGAGDCSCPRGTIFRGDGSGRRSRPS